MASFPFAFWRLDPNFGPTGLGFNYGYQFDGVDEYIDFGNVLDNDGSDAFSISARVRLDSNNNEVIFSKYQSAYYGYALYIYNGKVRFLIGQSSVNTILVDTVNTLHQEVWLNVTLTYDGSKSASGVKIYVDNSNESLTVSNDTFTGSSSNSTSFLFGRFPNLSGWDFNGRIDDVQYYDFVLNASQVSDIYNSGYVKSPTASPVHHWKMGEDDTFSTNWTVNDSVGSLDGTSVNMEETDRKLGVAYSMAFDGVDEYADFGDIYNIEYTDSITWSFWYKNTPSGNQDIIGRNELTNYKGWYIYDGGGKINIQLRNNNSNRITVGWNKSSAVWHYVTITYNGNGLASGLSGYVDGSLVTNSVTTDTLSSNSIQNTGSFRLSEFLGSLGRYNGNMMYVSIFDSELSASDVTSLYNSGVPVDPRDVGLSPSFFAPLGGENDSFSTNWTFVDEVNGNNGTSVNMEESDKTSETP